MSLAKAPHVKYKHIGVFDLCDDTKLNIQTFSKIGIQSLGYTKNMCALMYVNKPLSRITNISRTWYDASELRIILKYWCHRLYDDETIIMMWYYTHLLSLFQTLLPSLFAQTKYVLFSTVSHNPFFYQQPCVEQVNNPCDCILCM